MALVPTTRNQAVLIAEAVGDESALTESQLAAFTKLYRLKDSRTVRDLVITGEIKPIADSDVLAFLRELRQHGINDRAELDHISAFLRNVDDQAQKSFLQTELPKILRGYFLAHCMKTLDKGVKETLLTEGIEDETKAINRYRRGDRS